MGHWPVLLLLLVLLLLCACRGNLRRQNEKAHLIGASLLCGTHVQPGIATAAVCCRGNLRRQNEKAHLIGHVKDVGVDSKHQDPTTRIYLTSVAQPWHVDGTDVVGE
jgi:hypothetical protein